MLHDRRNLSAGSNDAPIPRRVVNESRHHCGCSTTVVVMLHHPPDRHRAKQRNVAGQQNYRSLSSLQRRFSLEQRVPGPKLRLLQCKHQTRPFRERLLDLIGAVTDDDDGGCRRKGFGNTEHVLDQTEASDFVENLGP